MLKQKRKQGQSVSSRSIQGETTRQSSHTGTGKSKASSHSKPKSSKLRSRPAHPARSTLIKRYEVAVRLLYRQQFEKARSAFEKVIATDGQDKEICERALTHLRLCQQKIARRPRAPRTTEEHYNVAITLINNGRYEESIHHLNRALKLSPKCDYVIYALAVSNCRLGNIESALKNLKLAINLKAENRFLAQRDADFAPLARDSRFISLIYPGEPSAATS